MLMLSFPNNGVGFLEPIFTVAATKSFIVSAFCAWHKSAMEIEWSKFALCWVLSSFSNHLVIFEYFSTHTMLANVYVTVYFACADDGIGRFDRSTASQQSLMELFIFGLNQPEKICGNRDDPDDVCEWKGVKCNAGGEVEDFKWVPKKQDGAGTVGFEFLPWSIRNVVMWNNALSGTIQLADLPGKMEVVDISYNNLIGCLHLDSLPAAVQELDLSRNKFTGDISLENLPKCLEYLSLSNNQLSGTICLTSLPPALEYLHLGRNNLEGSLDFTRLPTSICEMVLSENRFSGTIDFGNLPESMGDLDAKKNAISGTIRLPHGIVIRFDGNDELTVERIE